MQIFRKFRKICIILLSLAFTFIWFQSSPAKSTVIDRVEKIQQEVEKLPVDRNELKEKGLLAQWGDWLNSWSDWDDWYNWYNS